MILSNPKMLLVFGALIPQFISPERDFAGQLTFLVVVFMVLAAFFDSAMRCSPDRPGLGCRAPGSSWSSGFPAAA